MSVQEKAPPDPGRLALIGAPSSAGARKAGQELAPRALRDNGLVARLRSAGHRVVDLGDLPRVAFAPDPLNPKERNLMLTRGVLGRVANSVDAAAARRLRALVIGGDCTITIGVIAALTSHIGSLGLVYLDGDLDLNTPETTLTGILDGMVLAHLLGRGAPELSRLGSRHPLLDERDVVLFGYSLDGGGIDPVEIELLRSARMARYPLEEIESRASTSAAEAVRALESRVDGFAVHFDVDVVDAEDFPAVDVPHTPGLGLAAAAEALGVFMASPKAVALVVTEFNAALDRDGSLARRLNDTLLEVLPVSGSRAEAG